MTSPFPCSRGCLTAAEAGCVYPDCVQATDARLCNVCKHEPATHLWVTEDGRSLEICDPCLDGLTAARQATGTLPSRRLMQLVDLEPNLAMGRDPGRTGQRARWHILSDEVNQPLCGSTVADDSWDYEPFEAVPAGAKVCRLCHTRHSWAPMPHEFVMEDRGYTTPCRIWTRTQDGQGYGRRHRDGAWQRPHREAYEAAHGPIRAGLILHHKCEQKDCFEVDHMETLTRAEHCRLHNPGVATRWQKGQRVRG